MAPWSTWLVEYHNLRGEIGQRDLFNSEKLISIKCLVLLKEPLPHSLSLSKYIHTYLRESASCLYT